MVIHSHCECLVFCSFHYFSFAGAFVIDAYEVEDSVDDDAVEFFFIGGGLLFGIGADGVKADEEVAGYGVFVPHLLFVLAVIEGDDVCIVVVL